MQNEMVRRVAGALRPFFSGADCAYGEHVEAARAAIAELREPTRAMLETVRPCPEHLIEARKDVAGYETSMRTATTIDQMSARSDWQSMIDAALLP